MATDAEILDRLRERLYEVLEEKKPTYQVGSRKVHWTEYAKMLNVEIDRVLARVALESTEEHTVFDDPNL